MLYTPYFKSTLLQVSKILMPCANLCASEDAQKILESWTDPTHLASVMEIKLPPSQMCMHVGQESMMRYLVSQGINVTLLSITQWIDVVLFEMRNSFQSLWTIIPNTYLYI